MLKFDIIDSPPKMLKHDVVRSMIEKMKFFQGIDVPLGRRAKPVFITVESDKRKIMGGACLLKKELSDLQADVGELIGNLTSPHAQGWECSTVYLDVPFQASPSRSDEDERMMQNFYRKLYDGLVAFGVKKNIDFIIMKLLNETYISTRDIGLWPYVVELKPLRSGDGLFHGILPLVGREYGAYKKLWRD